jgi:hypothetical protein
MATGGYLGGVLFDMTLSYARSFALAAAAGVANLAVIGALAASRNRPARSGAIVDAAHRVESRAGRKSYPQATRG